MTFEEAEQAYQAVQRQRALGTMSPGEAEARIGAIRVQDASGTPWQMNPVNGAWLRWAGGGWAPGVPPRGNGAGGPAATSNARPQTLLQLLGLLLKTYLRLAWKLIPLALILLPLLWLAHTVFVIWLNEGTNPAVGGLYSYVLAVVRQPSSIGTATKGLILAAILSMRGGLIGGTLLWTLLGMLLSMTVVRLVQGRLGKSLGALGAAPSWARQGFQRAGRGSSASLLAGAAAALLAGDLIDNRIVSLQLTVLCLGALAAQSKSVLALALTLGRSDVRRAIGKAGPAPDPAWTTVFIVGSAIGFAATILLPPWIGLLLGVPLLLLAAVLGLARGSGQPPAAAMGVLLLVGLFVLLLTVPALADDGGWQEAGGTFVGWITSEGAVVVILYGLPPSIGFPIGIGNGVVIILGGDTIFDGMPPASDTYDQPPATVGDHAQPPGQADPVVGAIPTWDVPGLTGGVGDNPYTSFDGGGGPGACKIGAPNYWVSTATLQLFLEDELLAYGAFGPGVRLALTHSSDSNEAGLVGRGWRLSYESHLKVQGDRIRVRKGSGKLLLFGRGPATPRPAQGPVEAETLDGTFNRLLDHGEQWEVVEKRTDLRYWYLKRADGLEARLARITDRAGNTVRLDYDAGGLLTAVVDPSGRVAAFTHDQFGRCVAMRGPDGRTASLLYDHRGLLVRVTDFAGLVTEYAYDAEGAVVEMVVGRERNTTRFAWQRAGATRSMAALTDATGCTTRYELVSDSPRVVRVIDPEGRATTYEGSAGLTEVIRKPSGAVTRYSFARGLPTTIRTANGATYTIEYDAAGNAIRTHDPEGRVSAAGFDRAGNLLSEIDPTGATWQFVYDERGGLASAVSPLNRTIAFERDARGLLLCAVDTAGRRTTYTYDTHGNRVTVTDPLGRTSRAVYDPAGLRLVSVTDAKGQTTKLEYDGAGRVVRRTHPDGSFRVHVFDCCAGVSTMDEAGRELSYERDAMRRILAKTDELGAVTRTRFDRSGRMVEQTDPMGRTSRVGYDPDGRITELIDAGGAVTRFGLDAMGDLVSVTNPGGRTMAWERDAVGRTTAFVDPLGRRVRYESDQVGRMTALVNARGTRVDVLRDGEGRETARAHAGVQFSGFEYDAANNLASMTDAMGVTRYRFDAAGQHVGTQFPDGTEIRFAYDLTGLVESITYPGGLLVQYGRDPRGRLTTVRWGAHSVSFRYDVAGGLIGEARSNGTETTYVLPAPAQRVVEIHHLRGGGRFASIRTELDPAGQVVSEDSALPLQPFPADEPMVATYDGADQLATLSARRCVYDADGNLVEIEGGVWRASFDPESRLTRLERGGVVTEYAYDGHGQRVRVATGDAVRVLHHDGVGRVQYETDASGRVLRWNVWADDRLVAAARPDGSVLFYHADRLGSTVAITDARGEVLGAFAYSPYGVVKRSGREASDPYTFVGALGVTDEGGDLYFMRTRFYAAAVGRFVQRDSIGVEGGANLYAYVGNRPLGAVDPDGTIVPAVLWGAAAVLTLVGTYCAGKKVEELMTDTQRRAESERQYYENLRRINAPGAGNSDAADRAYTARDRFARDYRDAWNTGGEAAVKGVKQAYGTILGNAGGTAAPAVEKTVGAIGDAANIFTEGVDAVCGGP